MHEAGFTKLFSTIITSTVWQEDLETKVIWITMLALANRYGEVPATEPGISNASGVKLTKVIEVLKKFQEPDKYSRSKEFDGRRIERIDGGYRLLNYERYRKARQADERREYVRKKVADYRAKKADVNKPVNNVIKSKQCNPIAEAEAKAYAENNIEGENTQGSCSSNNGDNDDKVGEFTEKLIKHWNSKCLIKCESIPEQLAVQRQFAATKLSLPQEELLTAIDYYAEACALPDSQAFKKWTLYQWLLKGHFNKFLPGQFNIENYRKSNFEKGEPSKESKPPPKVGKDGLTARERYDKQQAQETINAKQKRERAETAEHFGGAAATPAVP